MEISTHLYYKDRIPFLDRTLECKKAVETSPNFIPIIIEKNENSTLPSLRKNKLSIKKRKKY